MLDELDVEELELGPGGVSFGLGANGGVMTSGFWIIAIGQLSDLRVIPGDSDRNLGVGFASEQSNPQTPSKSQPT